MTVTTGLPTIVAQRIQISLCIHRKGKYRQSGLVNDSLRSGKRKTLDLQTAGLVRLPGYDIPFSVVVRLLGYDVLIFFVVRWRCCNSSRGSLFSAAVSAGKQEIFSRGGTTVRRRRIWLLRRSDYLLPA